MGGGLYSFGIQGLELIHMVEDPTQIMGHGLDLVVGQRQPSQFGGALDIFPGNSRHGAQS